MIYENTLYKLSSDTEKDLLNRPETGMGYQIIKGLGVEQFGRSTSRGTFIALNASFAIMVNEPVGQYGLSRIKENMSRIQTGEELNLGLTTIEISGINIHSGIQTNRDVQKECLDIYQTKVRKPGPQGATDSTLKNANGAEIYVRLSAFPNDKRIDATKKCLLPGSFTTLNEDYNIW